MPRPKGTRVPARGIGRMGQRSSFRRFQDDCWQVRGEGRADNKVRLTRFGQAREHIVSPDELGEPCP